MQPCTANSDRRVDAVEVRLGNDVEQRIGRRLAKESDRTTIKVEPPAGKFISATDEIGPPLDRRIVDGPAKVEIGTPLAVETEAGHRELIACVDMDIEPPGSSAHGLP